ncbi:hypothetical protein HN803_06040 [candidate division WWE3 bacterium]|jgi:hypothetical protein|nr:hypothetical protein [candidate division WWE3 bacterium]MBT7350316.1 hypothetical protein [candidate division WWE3 bacterium]
MPKKKKGKRTQYPYPNVLKAAVTVALVSAVVTLGLVIVGLLYWGWSAGLIFASLFGSAVLGFLAGIYVEYKEDKKKGLI